LFFIVQKVEASRTPSESNTTDDAAENYYSSPKTNTKNQNPKTKKIPNKNQTNGKGNSHEWLYNCNSISVRMTELRCVSSILC
jgi:hypothetical protein